MDALRLFLAIDIPNGTRETIAEVQNSFKTLNLDARWVEPVNFHLTLKFLGNTRPQTIPEIESEMQEITPLFAPPLLSLGPPGVFPNPNRPRVLWLGVEDTQGILVSLMKAIDARLRSLGFAGEKKQAIPHLTLARFKSSRDNRKLKQKLKTGPAVDTAPFRADRIKLYQSELTPKGAVYTPLKEFPLAGPTMHNP